jgi:glycyl-tRNA synthetase beta chain
LRPIHWVCVLHGATTLPIQIFSLTATNQTHGHRFHFPQPITIPHADNYLTVLKEVKVIADQKERLAIISDGIKQLAEKNSGKAIVEDDLINQVCGLVEWPVALYAHFDRTFLNVPQEALISSMQTHQKCFAVSNHEGKLLPTFILISNTQAHNAQHIIHGNERVMHARLSDAKFFYDQDRKKPLSTRLEGLKKMVFQKKLGSLYDKSQRIAKLAAFIAKKLGTPSELSERAAKLCKCDLLTDMVFEFPELQGIMGHYYALNDGEPPEVALAIRESYYPRFAKDSLPCSPTGICVALADRLDTLIGIFGIGQTPSGDKDPFGLRRQALGILRILIENGLPLDLEELLIMARRGYGNLIDEEVVPQVLSFCFERCKAWYQEKGISPQTLEAVMAVHLTQPYDCSQRVNAVNHFQTLPEAQHLASANKRVRNILQKSGISINLQQLPEFSLALLKENAEINLAKEIEALKIKVDPLIALGKYQEALILLAHLQKPVDRFFEEVHVMADDENLRKNRINLLGHLVALFMRIADISKLVI